MRRPGPLRELPLEHFLPPNPNLPKSPFKSGNKRPLSPGTPSIFSPAKRRILDAEGIFSEKNLKSPLSASSSRALRSPARFGDLARGPDSPARKLDFGLPKNHSQSSAGSSTIINSAASSQFEDALDKTPTRTSFASTSTLAPSPELVPKSSSAPIASSSAVSLDDTFELDDYFSPRPQHPTTRFSGIPTMIPREIPPPPDRQSVHYPGFDIQPDTHIPLLQARSTSVDSTDSDNESKRDKEAIKENVPLRRRAKKAATAPTSLESTKAGLLSPVGKDKMGKSRSTPGTPKRLSLGDPETNMTPTPRRHAPAGMRSSTERIDRRKRLEDEVDEVGGDEDTVDEML